ncbi:hypothetical protein B0T16DRAFT_325442 [Cercophora newfieldiana]|uniref:Uncharacterized protein n=1 Tax=Cercophora newfieldiana TaxID=92897 RepID=A0AA40CTX3_9PEZI|nr:hypothetical protein B0T16DRAFT_325442 [Cercophora newfieldiana]
MLGKAGGPLAKGVLSIGGELLKSISVGVSADASYSQHYSHDVKMSSNIQHDFSKTSSRERSYGTSRNVAYRVTITSNERFTKPDYAANYCGSWFAVPIMGVDCGRASIGTLVKEGPRTHCAMGGELSSFEQCFDYTFEDPARPEASRYKMIFVLRDCAEGFILPGEWQHPAFANSFGIKAFANNHIRRFGMANQHSGRGRLPEETWNYASEKSQFTKTLGPSNYTVEVCGRGKYCARHKLEDNTCYTFPRGYSGVKSAHIVSANTSPGNCCVLFSRPECFGLAQVLKGAVDDFSSVGFEGMAHSVMCNVSEYCDADRIDVFAG